MVNLLLGATPPVLYCIAIQQEVADRILARPRTKDYGPLSILFQALCDVESVAALPPPAFWPEPQVASAMLRISPSAQPVYRGGEPARFMERLRAGFAFRRKKLRITLGKALNREVVGRLEQQVDLNRRAEELSVAEWVALEVLMRD